MNIDFKVLWIEDQKQWYKTAVREAENFIREHELSPSITNKLGNEEDIEQYIQNDYDLILMDYQLAQITGDVFIRKIRDYQIYTDVIFYSADKQKMLEAIYNDINSMEILEPPIDGIYYSERKDTEFYDKLQKVIDKIVRREQDVINLRGIVLDNTSKFDNQMNAIMSIAWQKLNEEEKIRLRKYVSNDVILESKESYIKTMDDLIAQECCYTAAISSRDYLIDSKKKAGIFGRVINELRKHHKMELDDKYKSFADNYYKDIIQYRNALGHAQTNLYGDKNIYVGEINGEPIEFNEDLCRQLRASITEYAIIFDQIINYLTNSN